MYIVKITNNTPLCKMVNFSRSVLKIYTGQKKFTRAAPVAPVTNIRYARGLSSENKIYTDIYTVNCQFTQFRVKSVKIYTGQKKFTRAPPVAPVTNMRYVHFL